MEQKLHTPEGVRDIYSTECRKKLTIQEKLHHLLHLYGYQDIQTPTFEYFDVFRDEIGTISSRELYKFFDRDGDTLALRRTSRRRSRVRRQPYLKKRNFRQDFVISGIHLSIIPVIRDA